MRVLHAALAVGLSIACAQEATAGDLVYTPIDPSFGGNPCSTGSYDECPIVVLRWPGLAYGITN